MSETTIMHHYLAGKKEVADKIDEIIKTSEDNDQALHDIMKYLDEPRGAK